MRKIACEPLLTNEYYTLCHDIPAGARVVLTSFVAPFCPGSWLCTFNKREIKKNMIIDEILNRKDTSGIMTPQGIVPYTPKAFYEKMCDWGELAEDIAKSMDSGEEQDVKRNLNIYVVRHDYNPDICNFINSVNWL